MGRNTTKGGDAEEREKGGGAEEREVGADASSTLDWALCEDEASELVSFLYCNETAEWARDSWVSGSHPLSTSSIFTIELTIDIHLWWHRLNSNLIFLKSTSDRLR